MPGPSCLDNLSYDEDSIEHQNETHFEAKPRFRVSPKCLKRMAKRSLKRLIEWLLEVEMGFVWGVAGLSIITFVFAAIWYIDPALLTLVLRFRKAECTTKNQAFLIGISNCSWTSCRLGCTREVYKCWQIQVEFDFVEDSQAYEPPWASVSMFDRGSLYNADYSDPHKSPPLNVARLYPNVRGCGYPPELNCEEFYETHKNNTQFPCWVSTLDTSVAITSLDLERAKGEVLFSLIPLLVFILFVLYAFCRMGVFAICNPLRMCPDAPDTKVDLPGITPKKLMTYKRGMSIKRTSSDPSEVNIFNNENNSEHLNNELKIPDTIKEDPMELEISDNGTEVLSNKQIVTSAEVLPRKLSSNVDELIEQELLSKSNWTAQGPTVCGPFSSETSLRSETNTVINELFGEELQRMDQETLLTSKMDVLDLKELQPYDNSIRKRPEKSPKSPSPSSLNSSLWDYNNDEADFENNQNFTTQRAKHL